MLHALPVTSNAPPGREELGFNVTPPSWPLNVVRSSCAIQAARIIHLHPVQYSIQTTGVALGVALLLLEVGVRTDGFSAAVDEVVGAAPTDDDDAVARASTLAATPAATPAANPISKSVESPGILSDVSTPN